jgi:SAM-dependent methyltransferase
MPIIKKILRKTKFHLDIKSKIGNYKLRKLFRDKTGIEIGGPTALFASGLPIYEVIENLDGCNFNVNTVWEGNIKEGHFYNYYTNKIGYQYICEASELTGIESEKYDFLLASHCLEHCANCLKTLQEWIRIIKPGGFLLLILPDKRFTFDHKRKVTSFQHLLEDLNNETNENDLTHIDEIITYHDLELDIAAGDKDSFKRRSVNNFYNRCLHHHVFDFDLLLQISNYLKLTVKYKKWVKPYHQIIILQK